MKQNNNLFKYLAALLTFMTVAKGEGLIEYLKAGYEHNLEMIQSAQGSTSVTFKRLVSDEKEDLISRGITTAADSYKADWAMQGDQRRVDKSPLPTPENFESWGDGRNSKIVWNNERRFYLHEFTDGRTQIVFQKEWPEGFKFIRNVPGYFDPMLFFHLDRKNPFEWLEAKQAEGYQITVNEDDEQQYTIIGRGLEKFAFSMIIGGDVGFNVKHYELTVFRNGVEDDFITIDVNYSDWESNSEAFFPMEYHLRYGSEEADLQEFVDAKFENVALNPDISEEMFTLDGLKPKAETAIYDYRRTTNGNQPLKSFYKRKTGITSSNIK